MAYIRASQGGGGDNDVQYMKVDMSFSSSINIQTRAKPKMIMLSADYADTINTGRYVMSYDEDISTTNYIRAYLRLAGSYGNNLDYPDVNGSSSGIYNVTNTGFTFQISSATISNLKIFIHY